VKTKAKRTLVKSAPELWALATDEARMGAWTAGLAGSSEPVQVKITDRRPQRSLAWRGAGRLERTRIAIQLAERGFGTAVKVSAHHDLPDPAVADAALERLLDELGSPERRPFTHG
jgi:hypothetical protein